VIDITPESEIYHARAQAMSTILSVTNLAISFGQRSVVKNLGFELHAGEALAILGPNGAGKTVLLRALLRLLPYEGQIKWAEDARIGYVPQKMSADLQLPVHLRDLLEAKARFLKLPAEEAGKVAAMVELAPELLNSNMSILSGGQFQKALIAFALLGKPNVLLVDEPTASLDELTEERVYELLHRLRQEQGITVVLVSHDLSIVNRYATAVLCLNKTGVCFGAPKEVLTPEALEALYAAPPKYYQHLHDHRGR
jgi:zinc transport system ATP-binding protein